MTELNKELVMNLQKKTLNRYRQIFPQDTLREVSQRTGIQITRVFRLFNGKMMKVEELEAFESAIQTQISEKPSYHSLSRSMHEALFHLPPQELNRINDYIERKIFIQNYRRLNQPHTVNADIA
jgi:hypothetical protein